MIVEAARKQLLTCNIAWFVGEPQFVARPGSTSEDDGVVMSTCMGPHGNSFLIILDAASWTELARAQLPYATPVRFHGTWVPAAS